MISIVLFCLIGFCHFDLVCVERKGGLGEHRESKRKRKTKVVGQEGKENLERDEVREKIQKYFVCLQDKTETWDKRGIQESMGVTLTVTHYTGDMEPKEATSCNQAGTPVERQRHPPMQKTFNPNFILSTRNAATRDRTETEGLANQ